jgi:hypothetical protein
MITDSSTRAERLAAEVRSQMAEHDNMSNIASVRTRLAAGLHPDRLARFRAELVAAATPIDFAELERGGVLQKVGKQWYRLLKPEALPAHAWQQVKALEQTRSGGRVAQRLQFRAPRAAAMLLARFDRTLGRLHRAPAETR